MSAPAGGTATVPNERVVLLGASNAARGIATAIATARAACGGPFDLMAAIGHGRSYGNGSVILGRWLPGILDSQLWKDLEAREPIPLRAVITDVGNDILFGAAPEKISHWVGECIQRLKGHNARIVITGIPLTSIVQMSRWEFPLLRTVFFPGCWMSFDEAQRRSQKVDELLRALAEDTQCAYVEPQSQWYTRDRIHIARRHQAVAWGRFFSAINDADVANAAPATTADFFRVRSLTPYHRRIFGIPNGRVQPAATLRDGTVISLY